MIGNSAQILKALKQGELSAPQIAKITKLSKPVCYQCLRCLIQHSFVEKIQFKKKNFFQRYAAIYHYKLVKE